MDLGFQRVLGDSTRAARPVGVRRHDRPVAAERAIVAAFPEYFSNQGDLERYVRQLADLCGLRDWKVTLEDEHPGDGCLGSCECVYGRKVANIRLAEHDAIESLRHTIVHELLHPHLDPIRLPIENIRSTLGDPLYNVTHNGMVDAVEYATDAIASILAPMLPLPARLEDEEAA